MTKRSRRNSAKQAAFTAVVAEQGRAFGEALKTFGAATTALSDEAGPALQAVYAAGKAYQAALQAHPAPSGTGAGPRMLERSLEAAMESVGAVMAGQLEDGGAAMTAAGVAYAEAVELIAAQAGLW